MFMLFHPKYSYTTFLFSLNTQSTIVSFISITCGAVCFYLSIFASLCFLCVSTKLLFTTSCNLNHFLRATWFILVMLFYDFPHELAWNWHIYWKASQILVCSKCLSLICGGFQFVMTLWLYSLCIIQMMQRVCVERCSYVGLSGELTSRGLWTGSLRERWWFESRTSIRQWVTERRLVLFHDCSRHHRTLVPSVVLGHCSRLLRKGNVTWVKNIRI